MLNPAILIPRADVAGVARRWAASLLHAWGELMLDDDERFLHEARDLADLEVRLRCQERGRVERFAPLPP